MENFEDQKTNEMLDIARRTEVFNPEEMTVLHEIIISQSNPLNGYHLVCVKEDGRIKGFTIFGHTPLTGNAWDIYWLAVDPSVQKRGIGRRLLEQTESEIMQKNISDPVIRMETSSREIYAPARALYVKSGYHESGFIKDFYKPGDSLVIFSKQIISDPTNPKQDDF